MPEPLLIGLDIGSRHVKAGVLRADGTVLAVARRPTPLVALPDGGQVHPPADLFAAAEGVVRDAVADATASGADGSAVVGIGIASVAEAGVPVDAAGEPIGDVLAWHDPRPAPDVALLTAAVPVDRLFARTGLRAEAKHTLAKLAWLRRTEPERLRRATAWAGVADLIALRWTGRLATAASQACRTLAWDLASGEWAADLLALAEWSPDRMPEVVPADAPTGHLRQAAADRLGLRAGIPVAVAGHDHVVGAFGAGASEPGDVVDSMGTAEAILRVTAGPCLDDAVRRRGFSTGAHVATGRWYVLGGAAASGALVEWYLDLIGASASPTERYACLHELGADAGAPTGLVVRPTPRGRAAPLPDPEARASIEGLDLETDAARVGRAVLEGVAFHARWMLDELAALTSAPIDHVRLIGGGVADAPLVAIKAALGPGTIRAVQEPEAVIVGAALVAGLASGIHGSVDEAVAIAPPAVPVEHRLDASAYQQAYERWRPR